MTRVRIMNFHGIGTPDRSLRPDEAAYWLSEDQFRQTLDLMERLQEISVRLHNGKFLFEDLHIDRLFAGAKAIDLDIGKSRQEISDALKDTVEANDMYDGVHVRLMVTRGPKRTPFQDPRLSDRGPTIVIIAEFKEASQEPVKQGIRMFTVHVRRGAPDVQDPKLNSHSKLNCITAMIQAYKAGCDEALMLDPHGFVSTGNSARGSISQR